MGFWKDLLNGTEEGKDPFRINEWTICYWPKKEECQLSKKLIHPIMVDLENEFCINTADNQKQVLEEASLKLHKCLSDVENKSNKK